MCWAPQHEGHKSGPAVTLIQVLWNFQTVLFLLSVHVSISFKCCPKIPAPWLDAMLLQGNPHHCRAVFVAVYGQGAIGWWAPEPNQLLNILNVFPNSASASWVSCDHRESQRVKGMKDALRKESWNLRLVAEKQEIQQKTLSLLSPMNWGN